MLWELESATVTNEGVEVGESNINLWVSPDARLLFGSPGNGIGAGGFAAGVVIVEAGGMVGTMAAMVGAIFSWVWVWGEEFLVFLVLLKQTQNKVNRIKAATMPTPPPITAGSIFPDSSTTGFGGYGSYLPASSQSSNTPLYSLRISYESHFPDMTVERLLSASGKTSANGINIKSRLYLQGFG